MLMGWLRGDKKLLEGKDPPSKQDLFLSQAVPSIEGADADNLNGEEWETKVREHTKKKWQWSELDFRDR